MVERESPIGPAYRPGSYGNLTGGPGFRLLELKPGSVVEVVAWPGSEATALAAISAVTGLALADTPGSGVATKTRSAFGFAPRKWLVIDQAEGTGAQLEAAMTSAAGSVTDLSHGRTVIRVSGPRVEWVLAKLFAIDFALAAFPMSAGRATAHHEVFAQIQRSGEQQFDIVVFRSFARSFWKTLCHLAEEVGCEVV
ncbi:MAG: sarcosine oxidase subunit gamma [Rhizobiaceae bacterium]|nr:sarcosine oxidase subunit gamma [Rhizobiaceae bacterium]